MQVFKLMKLDKIIDIRKSMADGTGGFRPPAQGLEGVADRVPAARPFDSG